MYSLTVPVFQAISYEYAVEITYSIPEAASVLNTLSQVSLLSLPYRGKPHIKCSVSRKLYESWLLTDVLLCKTTMLLKRSLCLQPECAQKCSSNVHAHAIAEITPSHPTNLYKH